MCVGVFIRNRSVSRRMLAGASVLCCVGMVLEMLHFPLSRLAPFVSCMVLGMLFYASFRSRFDPDHSGQ